MARYNFTTEYIKGSTNFVPDLLSRMPMNEDNEDTLINNIQKESTNYEEIVKIFKKKLFENLR